MLVAVIVAVCNLFLEVGSLLAKVGNQLVVVSSLAEADSLRIEVDNLPSEVRHFLVAVDNLLVEVDNHVVVNNLLVEVYYMLVHVGFLLVEVESDLTAADNQLVLEGLSIVVVFPPYLLCDKQFPFLCANFCCPKTIFHAVERTRKSQNLRNVERWAPKIKLQASVIVRTGLRRCFVVDFVSQLIEHSCRSHEAIESVPDCLD